MAAVGLPRRLRGIVALAATLLAASAPAQVLQLHDAERFAGLLRQTGYRPSSGELRQHYLQPGSAGVDLFIAERIVDAKNLSRAISRQRAAYRKAVEICLPAARELAADPLPALDRLMVLLAERHVPPVHVLFGAGNSGGTASRERLAVALEVICRYSDSVGQARKLVEAFVVHEAVHVYQLRKMDADARDSLLRQALIEGFADYATTLVTGATSAAVAERHAYGIAHEKALWQEFRADMHGLELKAWMYGHGVDERPPDLAYWIGSRIAEAFLRRSADRDAALRTLLELDDPARILEASGYGARLDR